MLLGLIIIESRIQQCKNQGVQTHGDMVIARSRRGNGHEQNADGVRMAVIDLQLIHTPDM